MVAETLPEPRRHTEVAVGVLLRTDGALLFTTRPPGKAYAGYWEFPGGKIEAGETVEQALRRELIEELGVTIGPPQVWKVTEHDYPHALVRLTGRAISRCAKARPCPGSPGPPLCARCCPVPCRYWIGWPRNVVCRSILKYYQINSL